MGCPWRDRIYKRALKHKWLWGQVFKVGNGGIALVVPEYEDKKTMIEKVDTTMGHFGIKRVMGFLQKRHRWKGMGEDMKSAIQRCQPCAKI